MYSAEVVQESLQRRQQPWGWGAQWLAIRSWQQPNESNHWSWSSYNYTRTCQRTQHQPFYGHSAFEANCKGEKAQKVGALWADQKSNKIIVLKCCLLSSYAATWTHTILMLPNSNEQYCHIITQPYHGILSLFNGSDTYLTVWSPEYRVGWVDFNSKYIIFL